MEKGVTESGDVMAMRNGKQEVFLQQSTTPKAMTLSFEWTTLLRAQLRASN
jgi:hypothetical protein